MEKTEEWKQKRLLKAKADRAFGSHENLYSKYTPQIPAAAEREYARIVTAYVGIVKDVLDEDLPAFLELYKKERDAEVSGMRNDSATDLMLAVTQLLNQILNMITAKTTGFGLRRKLESLANLTRKLTVKEWKKAIHNTLGIDIREDYYLGDFYIEQLERWVEYNVGLIKTIPQNTLGDMRDIIYDGYTAGMTTTAISKEIRKSYMVTRKKALLLARDQIAKLNSDIQRAQQEDAGITEYIWDDCKDERVRASHRKLDGHKFSWRDPPVVDEKTGRRCNPGQDYNCRCIGRPVFNRSRLNLPLEDQATGIEYKGYEVS